MPSDIRKILRKLKKGLITIYGDQLKAVYLFGSYARGEERPPDSDIDVMIVLNGEFNRREVDQRSSEFVSSLCLEHDVVISWRIASETDYMSSGMPVMINIRKEGIAV